VAQPTVTSLPLSLSAAPPPIVVLSDKKYLCTGSTPYLDGGAGFSSYLWQDGSTGRFFNIAGEGIFWVKVIDSLGCTGSDTVMVKSCTGSIYIPNAFTPNNDGLNDFFRVVASPDDMSDFSMTIFNRWGQQVFISSDVRIGWDGLYKGAPCAPDTYVWHIIYKAPSVDTGETITLKGTLELIR
jgi:gliding motility-associated-like protein